MEPRVFFNEFVKLFNKHKKSFKGYNTPGTEWTNKIEKIMCKLGGNDFFVGGRHKKESTEFLNIDFNFFSKDIFYENLDEGDGNIPLISVEHENIPISMNDITQKDHRLFFEFNKLFALNSKLKVLIGYVKLSKRMKEKEELDEIKKTKNEFVKQIAKYIKKTPRKYFPNQASNFLIILGYCRMYLDKPDFVGYKISDKGDHHEIK